MVLVFIQKKIKKKKNKKKFKKKKLKKKKKIKKKKEKKVALNKFISCSACMKKKSRSIG